MVKSVQSISHTHQINRLTKICTQTAIQRSAWNKTKMEEKQIENFETGWRQRNTLYSCDFLITTPVRLKALQFIMPNSVHIYDYHHKSLPLLWIRTAWSLDIWTIHTKCAFHLPWNLFIPAAVRHVSVPVKSLQWFLSLHDRLLVWIISLMMMVSFTEFIQLKNNAVMILKGKIYNIPQDSIRWYSSPSPRPWARR